MKKSKLFTLLPLLAAPLMMTACNNNDGKIVIGICQIADHPALNAATEGFKQAVMEELGEDKVVFNFRNANADGNMLVNIMSSFVNDKVDLIMANATPCVQVASNANYYRMLKRLVCYTVQLKLTLNSKSIPLSHFFKQKAYKQNAFHSQKLILFQPH